MGAFDQRETSFETRFAQEEEIKFKANARRNHLAGIWAANKLGLTADGAEAYAKAIVLAELDKPNSDSVFEKIRADLISKGLGQSDHQIRRMLEEFLKLAIAEIKAQ
jgi:hypothetical protein